MTTKRNSSVMYSEQQDYGYILQLLKQFLVFASKYGIWLIAYISPIHSFIVTIFILLTSDFVTGVTKAIRRNERITSKRMRDTVIKMVFYSIAVFISFQVDTTLLSDSTLVLTRIIGGFIMLIEFQSNIENISEITGVNIWVALKERILEYFTVKGNQATKKDENDEL